MKRGQQKRKVYLHIYFPVVLSSASCTIGMRLSHVESHDKLEYNASNTVGL